MPSTFNRRPLTTLVVEGIAAWLAHQVGAALGYKANGRAFVRTVLDAVGKELVVREHVVIVPDADSGPLRQLLGVDAGAPPPCALGWVLLTAEGLEVMLPKSSKPLASRLQKWTRTKALNVARPRPVIPASAMPHAEGAIEGPRVCASESCTNYLDMTAPATEAHCSSRCRTRDAKGSRVPALRPKKTPAKKASKPRAGKAWTRAALDAVRALPEDIQWAPARMVVELVAAEAEVGRELPALRSTVRSWNE